MRMRTKDYRIPYIRRIRNNRWEVTYRKMDGVRIFVGRYEDRVDAFIEYNRIAGLEGLGLLRLQKGLRRRRMKDLLDIKDNKNDKVIVKDDDRTIEHGKVDDELVDELFRILGD